MPVRNVYVYFYIHALIHINNPRPFPVLFLSAFTFALTFALMAQNFCNTTSVSYRRSFILLLWCGQMRISVLNKQAATRRERKRKRTRTRTREQQHQRWRQLPECLLDCDIGRQLVKKDKCAVLQQQPVALSVQQSGANTRSKDLLCCCCCCWLLQKEEQRQVYIARHIGGWIWGCQMEHVAAGAAAHWC